MEALIKTLNPLVFFHPEETAFPCSIDNYLQLVDIAQYKDDTSLLAGIGLGTDLQTAFLKAGPFTQATLAAYSATVTDWNGKSLVLQVSDASTAFQRRPLNPLAPVYCSYYHSEQLLYVTYTFFYPLNLGKFLNLGFHQADVEFISFELDATNLSAPPLRVLMSDHGNAEANFVDWVDCAKTTPTPEDPVTRLKIFIALGSHGEHQLPGDQVFFRLAGLGNDVTSDRGATAIFQPALFDGDDITITIPSGFDNSTLYLRPGSIQVDPRFMQWKGKLGANAVNFPNSQPYFRSVAGYGGSAVNAMSLNVYNGYSVFWSVLIVASLVWIFRKPLKRIYRSSIMYLAENAPKQD